MGGNISKHKLLIFKKGVSEAFLLDLHCEIFDADQDCKTTAARRLTGNI